MVSLMCEVSFASLFLTTLFLLEGGNPITTLSKQIVEFKLKKINNACPLYDNTGSLIPKEMDNAVEKEFNRLLGASKYLCWEENIDAWNGKPMSLGEMLDLLIKYQEKHTKEIMVRHFKEMRELELELIKILDEVRERGVKRLS